MKNIFSLRSVLLLLLVGCFTLFSNIVKALPTLCAVSTTYGCSTDYFTNVTFATINNSTTCSGLTTGSSVFATPNPLLIPGNTYTLSVSTFGTVGGDNAYGWIDYNQDGTLAAGESVLSGVSTGGNNNTYVVSVTIPLTATPGQTYLRLRCNWYSGATSNPCGLYSWGQTHDYVVTIGNACPFTVSASNGGPVCPGAPVPLTGVTTAPTYTWTGPGGFTSGVLSPSAPSISTTGTYTLTASNGSCTAIATTTVNLLSAPPAPVVTPSVATICNGGTVTLTATLPPATVNLFPAQGWESGVPTVPGTPVSGWNTNATSTAYITQASAGSFPTASPHSGSFFADFHSFSYSGISAALISPAFSMTGITGGQITFWVYRDFGSFYTGTGYANEGWGVYMNTTGSMTGATSLGFVPRTADQPITGSVTGASTTTASGWQQYTVAIPASFSGATNYVLFQGVSLFGNDCYLDDITATGLQPLSAPVWTPITNLYSNAAGTTAYVAGTPALNVYVHPTTISTTTVVNYIGTVTNGVCTSSDTAVVTINPGAAAITGTSSICLGASVTLSNTTAGGTWTTSNTTVASINATTGVITGLSSGTDTVYYTASGCTAFMVITVTPGIPAITGANSVCVAGTTTLSNTTTGGTWTTATPAIATVNSTTGMVSGVGIGSAIITYTAPVTGCTDTALVNVIGSPNPITGTTTLCAGGGVITLSTTTTGGSWVSGTTGIATVNSSTGAVYGVSTGTATISYVLPSGCYVSTSVPVSPAMPSITGSSAVCAGSTISLGNTATGGTWTSGTTSAATIAGAGTTATVGGVASGSSIITYSTGLGCNAYTTITVNPLPAAISGPSAVCAGGSTISLTDATGTGSWSSSGPSSSATINTVGVVTGVAAGSVTITYTLPVTGCYVTTPITVNPLPAAITGASAVCEGGATVTVADATGTGSWSASPAGTLSIDAAGTITGGTAGAGTVSYTLPLTGCYVTRAITVNPLPAAIGGNPVVCLNDQTTLTDATGAGTWSSTNTSIASIDAASGVMTGAGAGSATIVYTLPATGCYVVLAATVNPLPVAISGITDTVCSNGAVITLTDATTGGAWSSGDLSIATIDATTGVVTGVAAGTAPITYTLTATGCLVSRNVTVLPVPAAISGTAAACEAGGTTVLTDATTPGSWSISGGGFATISAGGVVTGISAGTPTVTYTRSNGCFITTPITINPLPAPITGTLSVCQLAVTTLSSTSAGGSWTVGSPFIASVSTGGGVGGILPGTSTVTYTLPTGCRTSTTVTVNAIPNAIGGQNYVCFGGVATLSNTVPGGTWTSSAPSIASIEATTGIMHGLVVGAATMTYTTGTSGCFATLPITVNGLIAPTVALAASPSSTVCAGDTVSYSATITNGGSSPLYVWSINNVILSNATTYRYVPQDGDLVRLWVMSSYSCAVPDTASSWITMTVHPIVTPALSLSIAGGDTVCTGALTTVNANPVAGGTSPTYQWYVNLAFAGSGTSVSYTPANGDVVTAVMTSNAFCSTATTASATKIITVSPFITPFVSINSSLGLTTCEGYPEIFTTNMTGGGTAPTYQWAVNGINTVAGPLFSYAPVNGDNVQVTMTSNFPCLTTPFATANETITVLPITQPIGTISAQPGYIIPAGMNDTFTVTLTSGGGLAPTYQWFIDNVPVAGATNTVFITNTLINGDSVSCQVTNTDQCSGVSVFTSLVIAIGNNVGVHELTLQGSDLLLIPNPNSGTFTVKGNAGVANNEDVNLEIANMLGQVIYKNVVHTKDGVIDEQINLSEDLAAGMYLLNLHSTNLSKTFHFSLQK